MTADGQGVARDRAGWQGDFNPDRTAEFGVADDAVVVGVFGDLHRWCGGGGGVYEGGVAACGAEVTGDIGVAAGRDSDGGGVRDVSSRGEGGGPDQGIGGGGEVTEAALRRRDVDQLKALRRFAEGEGHAAGFTGLEGGGGDVDLHGRWGVVVGKGQCRAGR